LMKYKKLHAEGKLAEAVGRGELQTYRAQLATQLGALRSQTTRAIKSLEADCKAMNLPASEMAKFQDWARWEARMLDRSQKAAQSTAGYIRSLETIVQTAVAGSTRPPVGPTSAPPVPN